MTDEMDFVEYYLEFFRKRITELRMAKGVSEREMSLALGKGGSFINHIALGHSYPYFKSFFEICEYLEVTPEEFFAADENPIIEREICRELNQRLDGDLTQFLKFLKEIKPEHLKAFMDMYLNR